MGLERRIRDLRVAIVDLQNARDALIASLPVEVASEVHYNGAYRAAKKYPEHGEALNLLAESSL